MPQDLPIILASSSTYRRQILDRLGLTFECQSPDIDETALPGESPASLVRRLAQSKALAIASTLDRGLVIGSDQVAAHNGQLVGKPRNHADAVAQLRAASGNKSILYCGVAVVNAATGQAQSAVEQVQVKCRQLTDAEIERYLQADQPYHCCGSIKVESLGITLLQSIQSGDPNTITGLPVIQLLHMLRKEGVVIP